MYCIRCQKRMLQCCITLGQSYTPDHLKSSICSQSLSTRERQKKTKSKLYIYSKYIMLTNVTFTTSENIQEMKDLFK